MRIVLRHGVITDKPEEVILRYYDEMGKGARAYDEEGLPQDKQFREQLLKARRLANRLGGRGIPEKAIDSLCARKSTIEKKLEGVGSDVNNGHETFHAATSLA